jgi:stalled ribosome rescue protein Dom34
MYKKDVFIYRNNDIINEIYKYITSYLENEKIVIINQNIFYNQVCDYIWKNSYNSYKSSIII